jgi:uncharacterized protein YutE (UPF0331/DUF86 family)
MMNAPVAARESDLVEALTQHFKAEGFEVFIQPPSQMLPSFMEGFRPDMIALKQDKKIAIEIKQSSSQSRELFKRLSSTFAEHPDWELRFYYAESPPDLDRIETAPIERIRETIERAQQLRKTDQLLAALLVARAMLEALARAILVEPSSRPQPVQKLIESLASEGWITPSEASQLREISNLGNAAAHGQLDAKIEAEKVDRLLSILSSLLRLAESKAAPT